MGRLFWKIFFGFWLTLVITGAAVGTLVWKHNKQRIEQLEVLVDSPRAELGVQSAANILRQQGVPALKTIFKRRQIRHQRPPRLLVINDQGIDLLDRAVPEIVLRKARDALRDPQQTAIQQVRTPEGERFLLFVPRRDHPAMKANTPFPRYLPLLPLFILFTGSLIFSAGLAWYITRPIQLIREATNRFAAGNLDTRVMPEIGRRKDELTELANDFDHMAEQLQHLIATQKRLLNDVSHELRSPLARLQLAIELGRQQPGKINEFTQRIEKESQRLDQLVGELLTLSRLEAGVKNSEHDYFDINGLIESIVNDAQFEAKAQNKQVIFSSDEELLLNGSIELIHRAIENIIRNAIDYTPEYSQVEVSLKHQNNMIKVHVCDEGQGVKESRLKEVFQPFVRLNDENQNVKIHGYGLGLAIARRAIELHRGSINAYNRSSGGLCIEIQIPK